MADKYGAHRASRNAVYGPYDSLDLGPEPTMNTPAKYAPGEVAAFPNHVLAATSKVALGAASRNADSRPGPSYGSGVDNKPST